MERPVCASARVNPTSSDAPGNAKLTHVMTGHTAPALVAAFSRPPGPHPGHPTAVGGLPASKLGLVTGSLDLIQVFSGQGQRVKLGPDAKRA